MEIPTVTDKQTNVNNNNSNNPPTLPFGVWEQHQSWLIQTLIIKQTYVDYTLWSADPNVRRVGPRPVLNDTNFDFETTLI